MTANESEDQERNDRGYMMQKVIIYKTLRMIGYRRASQLANKSLVYSKHSDQEKGRREKKDETIVKTRNNNIQYLNYPETFLFAGSCTTCFFCVLTNFFVAVVVSFRSAFCLFY